MVDTSAPAFTAEQDTLAEIIEGRAQLQLRRSGYLELHNVNCTYQQGTLSLQGSVSSYYLLQLAQAMVSGLDGAPRIDNRLVVRSASVRADRCG